MTDLSGDAASGQILVRKLVKAGPLSDAERDALCRLPFRLRVFGRGEVVVEQGESPKECALLLSGIAFRYKLMPTGERQILSLQVPGDFMDLHSYVLAPLDHSIAAASNAAWRACLTSPSPTCLGSIRDLHAI